MSQQTQSSRTIGNISTVSSVNDSSVNLVNPQQNAIIGVGASTKNTTGSENTIIGTDALYESTGGGGIVAVGYYAAQRLISAVGAVLIGDRVAPLLLSGYDSVITGFAAGSNVLSAQGCVLIGPNCGTTADRQCSVVDDTAIGSHALVVGRGATCVGANSLASGDAAVCVGYSNIHTAAGGVTIGSYCSNTSPGSVVIGNGIALHDLSPSDNLIIVAGRGAGHLNIQNVLTGGKDAPGGCYDVKVAASTGSLRITSSNGTSVTGGLRTDSIRSPSITVSSASAVALWNIGLAPHTGGSWADLMLSSSHGTQVTFCDEFVTGVLNFTAQHRCMLSRQGHPLHPGTVLVATGAYCGLDGSATPTIDEAVPVVAPSAAARDPRVFGVVSCLEDIDSASASAPTATSRRTFRVGSMGFSVARPVGESSVRVIVNSGGEGGILVCDANGPIQNGDLLVSSPYLGLGMRQGDDLVRACTVAKATCDCDFEHAQFASSPEVREALIGCVYMC